MKNIIIFLVALLVAFALGAYHLLVSNQIFDLVVAGVVYLAINLFMLDILKAKKLLKKETRQ